MPEFNKGDLVMLTSPPENRVGPWLYENKSLCKIVGYKRDPDVAIIEPVEPGDRQIFYSKFAHVDAFVNKTGVLCRVDRLVKVGDADG